MKKESVKKNITRVIKLFECVRVWEQIVATFIIISISKKQTDKQTNI